MNIQTLIAAVAATTGGAVGAIAVALLNWSRLKDRANDLKLMIAAGDATSIQDALTKLMDEIDVFSAALARLRGALRIR